ncbi:MAG TPA: hypothetical protein VGP48_10415 [Stellaceae bacterium]|nr:hypothetical protein [Stellaceae bacterium]
MERFSLLFGLMALAAATLPTTPARADFFTLDGRFQCLDRANAVCGDARKLAPAAKPVAPVAPAPPEVAAMPVEPVPAPDVVPPSSAARADDPLLAIAQRVQARRPTGADLAALKQAAHGGNPRAIELLAWCALNAIGMPHDAVEAYLLYGAAASAALPHAGDNQALIYERVLDSDQRQQVLDLVNDGVALAKLSRAAR